MTATAAVTWDGHDAAAIATRFGLPHVELLAETDSTLDVAHALAERGTPAGTLVLADAQRAGRGRMGRSWSSQPGRGVWCTVVERPRDRRALDVQSIRVGLDAAAALDAVNGGQEAIRLKWPNDLLLGDRKLGGILVEARWSGTTLGWVAIGVGINVLPPVGVDGATGMAEGVNRVDVLGAVVGAIRSATSASRGGQLSREELKRYAARDALAGRQIRSPADGRVSGITASGALVVETERGREEHRSGTIQLAEDT